MWLILFSNPLYVQHITCGISYIYIYAILNSSRLNSELRLYFSFFCLFSTLFDFLPFEVILKQSEVDTMSQAIQIKVYNNMSAMSIYSMDGHAATEMSLVAFETECRMKKICCGGKRLEIVRHIPLIVFRRTICGHIGAVRMDGLPAKCNVKWILLSIVRTI